MPAISKLMFTATLLQFRSGVSSQVAKGYSNVTHSLALNFIEQSAVFGFEVFVRSMHKLTETKVNFPRVFFFGIILRRFTRFLACE